MICIKNKLTKSFNINFGLWFSNIVDFYEFQALIKSIFEF